MKRWLIWTHRYLGIPMSIVFVVWFLSGIVMMYTGGMPVLDAHERLARRGPIDLQDVTLSLADAAVQAGLTRNLTAASLQTLLGRPAYRLSPRNGRELTVFADNGDAFDVASLEQAKAEVARFTGVAVGAVLYVRTLSQPDQWTITETPSLPLEQFDVADGRGTQAYFSRRSGEVELLTNRGDRALAWAGAIPHWFYISPLRNNQPLWYWSVVWLSAAGCLMASLGIVLAIVQFRRSRPFRWSASIRYRGWMRWHYILGALFGVFALTWVFSGLLSMEPFAWTNATGLRLPPNAVGGDDLDVARLDINGSRIRTVLDGVEPYEIDFTSILGEPNLVVSTNTSAARQVFNAASPGVPAEPQAPESVLDVLEQSDVGAAVVDHTVLENYDAYYYARNGEAPLPVLRVKFDDPAATWYYFDLMTGAPVSSNHRLSRRERWLFNGLHSLDFGFWYDRRPFWDIGVILLLTGALSTSAIGMCLGCKRLFKPISYFRKERVQ